MVKGAASHVVRARGGYANFDLRTTEKTTERRAISNEANTSHVFRCAATVRFTAVSEVITGDDYPVCRFGIYVWHETEQVQSNGAVACYMLAALVVGLASTG